MPSYGEHERTREHQRRLPALERIPAGGMRAALTFDDGPDPEGTPAVLDALDAAGASATFFLLGEQLMRAPRLGREIVDRGHEVALHGFAHLHFDRVGPQAARDDLARAVGTFEMATGRRARFCRPPYGVFSEAAFEACSRLSLTPVYWSAWGLDWEAVDAARIADLVVRDLDDGVIVVLHDSARYGHRPSAQATVEAIAPIAAAARERELALVSLGEAVDAGGG